MRSSNLRSRNTPCARLPTIFNFRDFVQAGALMSYGLHVPALFQSAAELLNKILRRTKPADIPVEQPTTFRLVVNLKTAEALGLTIPESFLLRADTVAGTKCEFRLVQVTTAHE